MPNTVKKIDVCGPTKLVGVLGMYTCMCICTNHLTLYITFGNCHIPFFAAFPLCRTFDFFFATSLFFSLWYSYNMLCVRIHMICILVCDPICRVWRWLCEAEYISNKIHHVVNVWLFKKYLHIPVHVLIHVDTSPVVIHPWSRDTDTPKFQHPTRMKNTHPFYPNNKPAVKFGKEYCVWAILFRNGIFRWPKRLNVLVPSLYVN